MWTYNVAAGAMARDGRALAGACYSGQPGPSFNNPDFERDADVGPIPRGEYTIGPAESRAGLWLFFRLTPEPGTNTYGRDGFELHGDSIEHPGYASLGCIVAPRPIREAIAASGDTSLTVV